MQISLLTLQKLLIGEITYEEFRTKHSDLVALLKRIDDDGQMISSATVVHLPDEDDDLISFEFQRANPAKLFKKG